MTVFLKTLQGLPAKNKWNLRQVKSFIYCPFIHFFIPKNPGKGPYFIFENACISLLLV